MTPTDAIASAKREIDELIDRHHVALERRICLDVAATGPEDDAALDRPIRQRRGDESRSKKC